MGMRYVIEIVEPNGTRIFKAMIDTGQFVGVCDILNRMSMQLLPKEKAVVLHREPDGRLATATYSLRRKGEMERDSYEFIPEEKAGEDPWDRISLLRLDMEDMVKQASAGRRPEMQDHDMTVGSLLDRLEYERQWLRLMQEAEDTEQKEEAGSFMDAIKGLRVSEDAYLDALENAVRALPVEKEALKLLMNTASGRMGEF